MLLILVTGLTGVVLGVLFLFAEDDAWGKAAIALAWLVTQRPLEKHIRGLAADGGLPTTVRPRRAAWIVTLASIAIVAFVDYISEGNWANRRGDGAGWGLVMFLFPPLLSWLAVRLSLGGKPVKLSTVGKMEVERNIRDTTPACMPRPPSKGVLLEGKTRDDAIRMLGYIDMVGEVLAKAFSGEPNESAVQEAEREASNMRQLMTDQARSQVPRDTPSTLRWNLQLAATAYADAMRIVESSALIDGNAVREEIAARYRDNGITAANDLALVIETGRRARDHAAAELR